MAARKKSMLTFSAPETLARSHTLNSRLFTREATFRGNKLSGEGLADPRGGRICICSHDARQAASVKWCPGGSGVSP